jgi:hypothetical protein
MAHEHTIACSAGIPNGRLMCGQETENQADLKYLTIELATGQKAVLYEDALAAFARIRSEYQRFYDFVGNADPALIDAWHFTENVRVQREGQPA